MIDAEMRALSVRVLDACRARKWMLATAESCTGGLVAGALTEIAGSSDVVDRGFVTYSDAAKKAMLGVPEATLHAHGAVSRQTAEAMAKGALERAGVDLDGRDHRHRGAGRRLGREAGRARAFRGGRKDGRLDPSREALRRAYRPLGGPAAVGDRGARPCCWSWPRNYPLFAARSFLRPHRAHDVGIVVGPGRDLRRRSAFSQPLRASAAPRSASLRASTPRHAQWRGNPW